MVGGAASQQVLIFAAGCRSSPPSIDCVGSSVLLHDVFLFTQLDGGEGGGDCGMASGRAGGWRQGKAAATKTKTTWTKGKFFQPT